MKLTKRKLIWWTCLLVIPAMTLLLNGTSQAKGPEYDKAVAKVEKLKELFSIRYREMKAHGYIIDKQTRKDLEFVNRTFEKLRDRTREVNRMGKQLADAGASEAQLNKVRGIQNRLKVTIDHLPDYQPGKTFLANLQSFKHYGVKSVQTSMDKVDQQIAELRREVPEIIGPPEEEKKPGDFQRGMKNVLELRINNIYQFVEDAPVVFYLNGQPVRKGQEIRLILKEFKPNLHFSFHIRDKHAQYLENAAKRGAFNSDFQNRLFWQEKNIGGRTVRSTWYAYENFTVKATGQGAHNIGHIARGVEPDKRFGDTNQGNVADIRFSSLPAQNIELMVEGTIEWRRETGPVGSKPRPIPKPKERGRAFINFSVF